MVSPSRVISAESCEIVLCEVGADGTKAVTVDRMRRMGAATRRRGVIVELRFSVCCAVAPVMLLLGMLVVCDARRMDEGQTGTNVFCFAAFRPVKKKARQDDGTADATAAVCPCCSYRWAL